MATAKQHILIIFGGVSPEHEVSVITGLQVTENIDRTLYEPHVVYVTKQGEFLYMPGLKSRKGFSMKKGVRATFDRHADTTYLQPSSLLSRKIPLDAVYMAFHGSMGEGGQFAGMFEVLNIPYTATTCESGVITMNKTLTKEALRSAGVPTVEGMSLRDTEIRTDPQAAAGKLIAGFGLPLIVKPAHFGSSIGINIAKTEVELEKHLLAAAQLDSEILTERYLSKITEYNCSVMAYKGEILTSEVERPVGKDEILSFADKYIRGGAKKTGGTGGQEGMASLARQLPADISPALRDTIRAHAKTAYSACRCKGVVRIDFMRSGDSLYLTEVNSIPGSMAFYLWEASGISFRDQITRSIVQAIDDHAAATAKHFTYETDIIQRFTA